MAQVKSMNKQVEAILSESYIVFVAKNDLRYLNKLNIRWSIKVKITRTYIIVPLTVPKQKNIQRFP